VFYKHLNPCSALLSVPPFLQLELSFAFGFGSFAVSVFCRRSPTSLHFWRPRPFPLPRLDVPFLLVRFFSAERVGLCGLSFLRSQIFLRDCPPTSPANAKRFFLSFFLFLSGSLLPYPPSYFPVLCLVAGKLRLKLCKLRDPSVGFPQQIPSKNFSKQSSCFFCFFQGVHSSFEFFFF